MKRCQRIVDDAEGLVCNEAAPNIVPMTDRLLHIKTEANLCYKHLAEYQQRAASLRTSRKKSSTIPSH